MSGHQGVIESVSTDEPSRQGQIFRQTQRLRGFLKASVHRI